MLSPLQQMLMPSLSKKRISLLEVTTRSLSLGAQQLLAMRRRSRNGSVSGAAEGLQLGRAGSSSLAPVEHIELRALGRFLLRGLDNPKVLYQVGAHRRWRHLAGCWRGLRGRCADAGPACVMQAGVIGLVEHGERCYGIGQPGWVGCWCGRAAGVVGLLEHGDRCHRPADAWVVLINRRAWEGTPLHPRCTGPPAAGQMRSASWCIGVLVSFEVWFELFEDAAANARHNRRGHAAMRRESAGIGAPCAFLSCTCTHRTVEHHS